MYFGNDMEQKLSDISTILPNFERMELFVRQQTPNSTLEKHKVNIKKMAQVLLQLKKIHPGYHDIIIPPNILSSAQSSSSQSSFSQSSFSQSSSSEPPSQSFSQSSINSDIFDKSVSVNKNDFNNEKYHLNEEEVEKCFNSFLNDPSSNDGFEMRDIEDEEEEEEPDQFINAEILETPIFIIPPAGPPYFDPKGHFTEGLANPEAFPDGRGTFMDAERKYPISRLEYAQLRLSSRSNPICQQFADWVFQTLAIVSQEANQSTANFLIYEYKKKKSESIAAMTLEILQLFDQFDNKEIAAIYQKLGKSNRGTSQHLRKAKNNLFTQISERGPPDLFLTLGAMGDWPEFFIHVCPEKYRTPVDTLAISKKERLELLKKYPGYAIECFDKRMLGIMHMLEKDSTIFGGQAIDWFYRIEFQARGFPHAHCLLTINGAPNLKSDPEKYLEWVDKYITAQLPEETDELYDLVNRVQRHSHTFTCATNESVAKEGEELFKMKKDYQNKSEEEKVNQQNKQNKSHSY